MINFELLTNQELANINNLSAVELKKRGIAAKSTRHHFVGQKIGKLTIFELLGKTVDEKSGWQQNWFNCLCECYETIKTTSQYLNTCKGTACCKNCQKKNQSERMKNKGSIYKGVKDE